MALGKQAKTLTEAQEKAVLGFLADGRQAQRNRVMFLCKRLANPILLAPHPT